MRLLSIMRALLSREVNLLREILPQNMSVSFVPEGTVTCTMRDNKGYEAKEHLCSNRSKTEKDKRRKMLIRKHSLFRFIILSVILP